jgi:hypothetical protein
LLNIDPDTEAIPLVPITAMMVVVSVMVVMMMVIPKAITIMIVGPRLSGATQDKESSHPGQQEAPFIALYIFHSRSIRLETQSELP